MILPSVSDMVLLHMVPHPATFGLSALLEITVAVIPVLVPLVNILLEVLPC